MRYVLMTATLVTMAAGLQWPHHPMDSIHPIGNAWGNYQNYGSPYLHNGQDIMTASLAPAVAIKAGYVKKVWYGGSPMYNGVTVADSAGAAFCEGFMYYHIDDATIRVSEGDTIQVGDTLGLIAHWSVAGFHHNHFSANRNSGTIWPAYGAFYKNPLIWFVPDDDSTTPVFFDAVTNRRFAVCANNTSSYQDKDSVYGTVDLICRLEDHINHPTWKVIVYKLMYTITDTAGSVVVPLTRGFEFSDSLESYTRVQSRVVFKQDATCPTYCNYDSLNRRYYYIFTNTDGDSLIEATDSLPGWNTTQVADGYYWVKVFASDEHGNTAVDSMRVRVQNNPTGRHDVGVVAITSPAAMVDSGAAVAPACSVYNYGTYSETYSVRMRIGTGYDSTVTVASHAPGSRRAVVFPNWMASPGGLQAVSCSTELAGDEVPANDVDTSSTMVAVHDVGSIAIVAPSGSVDSGVVVTPRAVVRNYGNVGETFLTWLRIGSLYADSQRVSLAVGTSDTVDFADWTAHPVGTLTTRCTTALAGDVDPSNDLVIDSIIVRPEVGIAETPVPTAFAFAGVSPNPAVSVARAMFDLPHAGLVELELYDASGRFETKVLSGRLAVGSYRVRIDAGRLATGVYWLKLRAGDFVATRKLVVQR